MARDTLPIQILEAIQRVLGKPDGLTLLHRPYLPPNAWKYTQDCLDTGWVSSAGAYVARFEEALAEFTGAKRAVAVSNGTAALQVCFHLLGVQRDDEVIMPSLTFVATANAAKHQGATPHFVDASPVSFGICPLALRSRLEEVASVRNGVCYNKLTEQRIAAVCPMHCFGHACDMDPIVTICEEFGLALVEDAAESLGSYYKQVHTGRKGLVAAVSFNGNKILTTGGGGAILTDDDDLADKAKHLTTTAKTPDPWEFHHDAVAWNYRMPNVNAALGLAQLEQLKTILSAKRELYMAYRDSFESVSGAKLLNEPEFSYSNCWLNALVLDSDDLPLRNEILEILNSQSLQCRPLWQPMHTLPMYRDCPRGPLSVTESLYRKTINIPSSADLSPNWKG